MPETKSVPAASPPSSLPRTASALHPLEARFIKLALLRQFLTPSQIKEGHELLQKRVAAGERNVVLEQIFQEQGILTDDECEELWEVIAKTSDTNVRDEITSRKITRPGESPAIARPGDEEHPRIIGGFEIKELLGRGGMGAVYRARQTTMDRDVALKLLPPDLASNAKYIRRFIREARAAGMVNHQNLVRVYDVSEADGRYFISMEYVEGLTVKQIMRREGRIPVVTSLKIIEQVAAALDCAHSVKIVHRDIKPDNIMITSQGVAKLCDLGLAKLLEGGPMQDTDTQDGHTMGTPHYMSPEQAKAAGKVDARSDLYSLGATLYHMITGRVPFDGETPLEILMRVTSEAPVRPDRFEPLLPPPLTRLMLRLLAKNPSERPKTAAEVQEALHELRRDIELGRVFVFDDAPRISRGHPLPAPPSATRPPWVKPAIGLGAAACFFLLALWVHGRRERRAAPPAPLVFFDAPPSEAKTSPENTTETKSDPIVIAEPPSTVPVATMPPDDVSAPELKASSAEDQVRFAALRDRAVKLRDQDAQEVFARLKRGVWDLAHAGYYRQARNLLMDLPVKLREATGLRDATQAELTALHLAAQSDAKARGAELEALAKAGLHHLALDLAQRWKDEAARDGEDLTPELGATRKAALAKAAAAADQASAQARAEDAQLQAIREGVDSARKLSSKHDLSGGRRIAMGLLNRANNEPNESIVYGAEVMRLEFAQGLFDRLAQGINTHPGMVAERDFRPGEALSGKVTSLNMEENYFVIVRPDVQSRINLFTIQRREMRRLFEIVFVEKRMTDDDPLGRLAYDLDDRDPRLMRAAIAQLADADPAGNAARLLDRLIAADGPFVRQEVRQQLDAAEEAALSARYGDAVGRLGKARWALGDIQDEALTTRYRELLKRVTEVREAGEPYGMDRRLFDRERGRLELDGSELAYKKDLWHWSVGQPDRREQSGRPALVFGDQTVRGSSPWTLEGPCRVMLEVYLGEGARGALFLDAHPLDGKDVASPTPRWSLAVDAVGGTPSAELSREGRREPKWARMNLGAGGSHRLWLDLAGGTTAWGIGDAEILRRGDAGYTRWRLNLVARGDVQVLGLQVEGRFHGLRSLEELKRSGEDAFAEARQGGAGTEQKLKALLQQYGWHATLASRAFAELAAHAGQAGRLDEARYWESRALFECPTSLWPPETRMLFNPHLQWLKQRDRVGPYRSVPPVEDLYAPYRIPVPPKVGSGSLKPGGKVPGPGDGIGTGEDDNPDKPVRDTVITPGNRELRRPKQFDPEPGNVKVIKPEDPVRQGVVKPQGRNP
ncbi:MAG: protein kinase [Planctomycetes bacterium]|nr:protein kinase [Planctomycetota bacterium]